MNSFTVLLRVNTGVNRFTARSIPGTWWFITTKCSREQPDVYSAPINLPVARVIVFSRNGISEAPTGKQPVELKRPYAGRSRLNKLWTLPL